MQDFLERTIYRHGWDTRCRNWVPARILRRLLKNLPSQGEPVLLDVGCGRIGMAAFLNGAKVVGVDVEPPLEHLDNFTFQPGTITDLKFPDKSFSVVSCIDVLEHLPVEARDRAIAELVRVASRAVLVACPHGENGQACDAEFQSELENRGRPIPEWVVEHQRQEYPTAAKVAEKLREEAAASGRKVKITLSYSEPVRACRFVRGAAARSDALYLAMNLLLGLLLPLVPEPKSENSYRMVMLAELSSGDEVDASSTRLSPAQSKYENG
jgi:ubiquinone/menaquinone biosynthesis C-methylase UbiE